jgi:uncharacterized membrane protein YbaN (DUF454 family)
MEAHPVLSLLAALGFLLCSAACFIRGDRKNDEILRTLPLAIVLLSVAQAASSVPQRLQPDMSWIYLPRIAAFLIVIRKLLQTRLAG